MTDSEISLNREEVAIVGMAGRFPGATNVDEFWKNLCDGICSIRSFAVDELRACGIDEATLRNPSFVNTGAVIEDADCFDATFFGFSPLEAGIMDPQQRLFLECAWEALENAGYDPDRFNGAIGVFGGVSPNTYFQNNLMSRPDVLSKVGPQLMRLSNEKDHVCTRIAFKLNLKGPSISVNTACSSSGVALHLACQSLLSGECDMAMVGGARIEAPLKAGYLYEEGGILSPDGQCRVFDAEARGTVFGNGVCIVLIKRLSDAIRDGDTIHAVVKATAINNDGSQKAGYAAPSVQGQSAVIEEALAMAEISAETIGYLEAHGTGTSLGDPVEIAALSKAFRQWTDKKRFCPIGSVKSNIGHLFAGGGIAGVIKTVLALKHKLIPPSLNFKHPNPQIDFENSPFYVNDKLSKWEFNGIPRRAGVSSFGVGGTNAHMILEEAPESQSSGPGRSDHLLVLSAKSETALDTATARLADYMKAHSDINLADAAYTLQVGRKAFSHRRILVSYSVNDAVSALETHDPQRVVTYYQEPSEKDVVFMFSGQGSQYANMGLGLYQAEPLYRQCIDRCSEILKHHLDRDLRNIMFPAEDDIERAAQKLKNTLITQPALFTVEYALAKLWMSWGVRPSALVGHSIGEYVAACLAGVFSLEDALALVAARGRLIQGLPPGSMLAVSISEKDIESFLDARVSLAVVNGPDLCVISGDVEAVRELEETLRQSNVESRYLHTSHAFHSKMMDSILDPFTEYVRHINFSSPQIPIVSTVTGKWIRPEEIMYPDYWAKNLRQTVRFSDALQELMKEPNRIFLEVGPGQTLSTLAKQHSNRQKGNIIVSSIRHPYEKKSDLAFILNSLGWLWLSDISVDWSGFYGNERRHRIPLPTYPFEHQRYWVEPEKPQSTVPSPPDRPIKKSDVSDWFYVPTWKRHQLPKIYGRSQLGDRHLSCLVFLDRGDIGAELARRLLKEGQHVSTVQAGSEFSKISEQAFTINPKVEEDYHKLMRVLYESEQLPDIIYHCWCLTNESDFSSTAASLEFYQESAFTSLLFLAKSIGDTVADKSIGIKVISNNVHDVTGEEELVPEKAPLLGPCRVIPQEYNNVQCTNIDISYPLTSLQQRGNLLNMLLNELTEENSVAVVAYRGKHRWVQAYEPAHLEKVFVPTSRLRKEGVYLITGGLGGIGLELAEFLAQTVSPNLVLIGRTPVPNRNQWDNWLQTHSEPDDTSRKIRKIMEIEELGARVLTISADVADMKQMAEAKAQIHDQFGRIHGVIHAAGVAGGGMIQLKTAEAAECVLAPKVKGALNLDRLLGDVSLDFFVLCSSVSSVRGETGQVDYCAANAFLDAYAQKHASKHNVISINWSMWQRVGMGVKTDVPEDLKQERERRLELAISPEEGKEAFARILESPFPQVIVSPQDFFDITLPSKATPIPNGGDKTVKNGGDKTAKTAEDKPTHSRPNLSSVYIVPGNPTEQSIAEIWQQLLGIENVGIHDNFFELGGHSILGTQLIERMRATFGVKFPLSTLYERPTVHSLSQLLLENQEEEPSFVRSSSRGKKRKERRRRR